MYSQNGRILIVGGGAEKTESTAGVHQIKWAGEGKRVAIIGISTGSLAYSNNSNAELHC
ncbi:MAG: hypothetical protein IPH57_00125 [Saprospiraceae bacterium]|nr:hypothetical protein [Saprospiraceae bacterium]